jgi:hypothetical protein
VKWIWTIIKRSKVTLENVSQNNAKKNNNVIDSLGSLFIWNDLFYLEKSEFFLTLITFREVRLSVFVRLEKELFFLKEGASFLF